MDKEAAKGYWPFTLLIAVAIGLFLFFSKSPDKKKVYYNYSYIVEKNSARVGDVYVVSSIDTTEPGHETPALIEVRLSPQPTGQTAR